MTDRPASVQMDGKNLVRIPYECPDKIKYSFIWDPARRNPLIEKLVSLLKAKIPTQNLLEE